MADKNLLSEIQKVLCVPKDQKNDFHNFAFRSVEDINAALRKHMDDLNFSVCCDVDLFEMLGETYIKATATLKDKNNNVIEKANGIAREGKTKKGMDAPMETGSAQSYAKKYALMGLFSIDNEQDTDALSRPDESKENTESNKSKKSKKSNKNQNFL